MDADDRQNLHGWLARADKEDLGKLLEYMGDSAPKKSKQERLEVCLGYAGSMFTELDKHCRYGMEVAMLAGTTVR